MLKKNILIILIACIILLSGCVSNNGKVEKKENNEDTELLGKYKVYYVALDNKSDAKEVIDILNNTNKKKIPEKFCEIVDEYSVETVEDLNCGEMYYNDGDLLEDFESAVRNLKVGQYTKESVYSPDYGLYYVIYRVQ